MYEQNFYSITSTIIILAVTFFTTPGCAILGLEEEEEDTEESIVPGSITEMGGTWKTSCVGGDDGYSENYLTHSGSEILMENKLFFDDSSCSDLALTLSITQNEVSKGSEITLSDGSSGYLYYSKIKSATLKSHINLVTRWYNSNRYCGKTNWQTNVAKDVTGTSCFTGSIGNRGNGKYSISGNRLYFDLTGLTGLTYTKQ